MLSIIIPTYNEARNLRELKERIRHAISNAEVIIVDDNSPDRTAQIAQELGGIKVLLRPDKEGLASAVLEGIKLAKGDILCIMDADLSHPPEALSPMLELIEKGQADLVVGSRLTKGGGSVYWPWYRRLASFLARAVASPLSPVKDLTSGFLMFKKEVIEGVDINPIGFKIGLEILTKGKHKKALEFPITFTDRGRGKSKMGAKETFEYFAQVAGLYWAKLKGGRK